MVTVDWSWRDSLPTVEELDAYIVELESELQRAREVRQGVALIRGVTSAIAHGPTPVVTEPATPDTGQRQQSVTTIRGAVLRFLKETTHPFTIHDLVTTVRRELPAAKAHTVRGTLSHAKTRDEVARTADGRWVSRLADAHDEPPSVLEPADA